MNRTKHRAGRCRGAERGYALLVVTFVLTLMLIAVVTAAPSIYTQGQREREFELQWRGKQYVRGIKLFYRKNGRFPASIEELVKGNIGVHYMRKAYKDPMNTADGSWRLLYVGPGGQVIGSVKQNRNPLGTAPLTPGSAAPGPQGTASGATAGGAGTPLGGIVGQTPGGASTLTTPVGGGGQVFGGNIVGVASKIKKPSIMIYEDGRSYIEWEFVWDPSKDAPVQIGQPQQGNPGGAPPGTTPPGTPPGTNPPGGSNPPQNPPPPQS